MVKGSVLTDDSTLELRGDKLGVSVESDDPTVCLSALLPEDECGREALEGSTLPTRRGRDGGLQGCSHLLHHPTPGDFVVAGGGCRNRKCESMNYLTLSKGRPNGEVNTGGQTRTGLLCFDEGPDFSFLFSLWADRRLVLSATASLGLVHSYLCQKGSVATMGHCCTVWVTSLAALDDITSRNDNETNPSGAWT